MKLKTGTLAVRCYARHGDTCSLAPHCETLGCASKCKPDDYVLVAQFSYLQEASDYCREGASRGVRMHLVSRIVPSQPFHMDYSPSSVNQLDSNTTSAAKSEPEHAAKRRTNTSERYHVGDPTCGMIETATSLKAALALAAGHSCSGLLSDHI